MGFSGLAVSLQKLPKRPGKSSTLGRRGRPTVLFVLLLSSCGPSAPTLLGAREACGKWDPASPLLLTVPGQRCRHPVLGFSWPPPPPSSQVPVPRQGAYPPAPGMRAQLPRGSCLASRDRGAWAGAALAPVSPSSVATDRAPPSLAEPWKELFKQQEAGGEARLQHSIERVSARG